MHDRLDHVRGWLRKADRDLNTAKLVAAAVGLAERIRTSVVGAVPTGGGPVSAGPVGDGKRGKSQ